MNEMYDGTSTSGPPSISLRAVLNKISVSRSTARELWKKGLVVGLFNLQNEVLFEACTDFCIEVANIDEARTYFKESDGDASELYDHFRDQIVCFGKFFNDIKNMQDKAFYEKYVRPLGLERLYSPARGAQKQPGEFCELRRTTMRLRSQLKSNQSALEESESRYAALKKKYATLESELDASKRACQSQVKKYAALKSQLSVANAQLAGAKEDKSAYKKAMKDHQLKQSQLDLTYQRLVSEHEKLKKEYLDLKESLESARGDAEVRNKNKVGDALRLSANVQYGLGSHSTDDLEHVRGRQPEFSADEVAGRSIKVKVEAATRGEGDNASDLARDGEKNAVVEVPNVKKSGTKSNKKGTVGTKSDKKRPSGGKDLTGGTGRKNTGEHASSVAEKKSIVDEVIAAELNSMADITKGKKTNTANGERGAGSGDGTFGGVETVEKGVYARSKNGEEGGAEAGLDDTGNCNNIVEEGKGLKAGGECTDTWNNRSLSKKERGEGGSNEGDTISQFRNYDGNYLDVIDNAKWSMSGGIEENVGNSNTVSAYSLDSWRVMYRVGKEGLPERMFDRMRHMESIISTLQEELARMKQMYAELQQQNSELLSYQYQLSQTDELNRRLLEHYKYVMNITKTVEESDSEEEQGALWLP